MLFILFTIILNINKCILIFVLSYILKSEECFRSSCNVKNSNYCTDFLYIYTFADHKCMFIFIFFIFLHENTISQYFSEIVGKNNVRHVVQTFSFLYSHEV
jgi:hypothetical protein